MHRALKVGNYYSGIQRTVHLRKYQDALSNCTSTACQLALRNSTGESPVSRLNIRLKWCG